MDEVDLREDLRNTIRLRLAEGFDLPEMALEASIRLVTGGEVCSYEVREMAAAEFSSAVADREADQATWPDETDCDRLDSAFEELNAIGIMARHHRWCCSGCGRKSIEREFARLGGVWDGTRIIGYAFYHMQDTESAVEGLGLCLDYGSTEPASSDQAYKVNALQIGESVRHVLKMHGLKVEWDGSIASRIQVKVDWKRRARPVRFADEDEQQEAH